MSGSDERTDLVGLLIVHAGMPYAAAGAILAAGYRRVSADPDTVERVAQAIDMEIDTHLLRDERIAAARAAINAIGGGQ